MRRQGQLPPVQRPPTEHVDQERGHVAGPERAHVAATAATTQMAAALATRRLLGEQEQVELVHSSLPDLLRHVTPPLAAFTQAAGHRNAPGPAFGTAAFEALMDRKTESRARHDSSAHMLFDGVASFAERERLLSTAKTSIYLETFIFAGDETGQHTAKLLIAAARRGVDVMVIFDAMGSHGTPAHLFDAMVQGGVKVRGYNRVLEHPLNVNHRSHVKSLIVDGQTAIMGGMNVGDDYAFGGSTRAVSRGKGHTEGWRDTDVEVTGRAVADAQRHFLADWSLSGSAAELGNRVGAAARPAGGASVRVIEHRPEEKGDHNTMNAYVAAIESTEHTIEIENAYFLPPEPVRHALIAAARRGVVVRVRTNSFSSSDNAADVAAAHFFYPQLLAAGVQIHEQGSQMLHSKTATFDGKFSLVGSVNLNGRSDGRDAENVVAITDKRVAAELHDRFGRRAAETTRISPKDMEAEGVVAHLKAWSLARAAWTL